MNYVLHLTDSCNLNCKYCYEDKKKTELSLENIKKVIDYEISQKNKKANIIFYGGEPLLKKDLIKETIEYVKNKKTETEFSFGMTTNGVLLDENFIKYLEKNKFVNIAYSIDGNKEIHDLNRVTIGGQGSFEIISENAKQLLKIFPNAVAMIVATRNNIEKLNESAKFLLDFGFKTINILFDYTAKWKDEDLIIIREQFEKVGEIYYQKILAEEDINIPLLETKIKYYIEQNNNCNEECMLGMKNIHVGTDGNFYPCVQLVGKKEYIIGNSEKGINQKAREKLIKNSQKENEICKTCDIRKRCKHTCSCRNYMTTGDINEISPLVCEIERITIEIADNIASRLYRADAKLFIQKFYNEKYHLLKAIIEQ